MGETATVERGDMTKQMNNLSKRMKAERYVMAGDTNTILIVITTDNMEKYSTAAITIALEDISAFLETRTEGRTIYQQEGKAAFCLLELTGKHEQTDVEIELTGLLNDISKERGIEFFVGMDYMKRGTTPEQAYKHCRESIEGLQGIGAKHGVAIYSNLVFLDMFKKRCGADNKENQIWNDALKRLIVYDDEHGTSYVNTLKWYFAYECNISRTTDKLGIHRNVLKNRIDKISNICDMKVDEYFAKLYLSLALVTYDYYGL